MRYLTLRCPTDDLASFVLLCVLEEHDGETVQAAQVWADDDGMPDYLEALYLPGQGRGWVSGPCESSELAASSLDDLVRRYVEALP